MLQVDEIITCVVKDVVSMDDGVFGKLMSDGGGKDGGWCPVLVLLLFCFMQHKEQVQEHLAGECYLVPLRNI